MGIICTETSRKCIVARTCGLRKNGSKSVKPAVVAWEKGAWHAECHRSKPLDSQSRISYMAEAHMYVFEAPLRCCSNSMAAAPRGKRVAGLT